MALNDTFNIFSIKITHFGADLTTNFPIKDSWKEYKKHPSNKEYLVYCD